MVCVISKYCFPPVQRASCESLHAKADKIGFAAIYHFLSPAFHDFNIITKTWNQNKFKKSRKWNHWKSG